MVVNLLEVGLRMSTVVPARSGGEAFGSCVVCMLLSVLMFGFELVGLSPVDEFFLGVGSLAEILIVAEH